MTGKRYTYITYYYPPWGGVAAQWCIKLIKYLHRYGWEPRVITVRDTSIKFVDEEARADLPKNVPTVYAPNWEVAAKYKQKVKKSESKAAAGNSVFKKQILKLIRWFYENFYILEGQFFWTINSVILGKRLVQDSDVIFATLRPGATAVSGLILKKLTRKPLVIDYRDPWTQNMTMPTGGPRKWVEEKLERMVLEGSDYVVTVSHPLLSELREKYKLPKLGGDVLYLGYDPEDFQLRTRSLKTKKLNITYTGTLFASRSPEVFLRGLKEAIKSDPSIAEKVEVNFYGDFGGEAHVSLVKNLRLTQVVKIHGFLTHEKSIEKLKQADWVLLIVETIQNENRRGNFTGVYTGKLFEYLASGKPILALTPQSEARKLIKKLNTGVIVDNDDPNQVANEIKKIAGGFYKANHLNRDEEGIAIFSMDNNAKKLSSIFERVSK